MTRECFAAPTIRSLSTFAIPACPRQRLHQPPPTPEPTIGAYVTLGRGHCARGNSYTRVSSIQVPYVVVSACPPCGFTQILPRLPGGCFEPKAICCKEARNPGLLFQPDCVYYGVVIVFIRRFDAPTRFLLPSSHPPINPVACSCRLVFVGETCSNGVPGIDGSNEVGAVCCPLQCHQCGGIGCGSNRDWGFGNKECCINGTRMIVA